MLNKASLAVLAQAITREDLPSFVRKVVSMIEGKELRLLPHVELIIAHLLALQHNEIQRLIVNQPPRTMKSLLVVSYVAWLLGKSTGVKVAIVCHDEMLADSHVDRIRQIVESDWYHALFPRAAAPPIFSRSGHFKTAAGCEVLGRSFKSGLTGHGFDLIVVDDPLDAGDADNEHARSEVARLFDDKIATRLNSQLTGQMIVVMQRLHEDDLCGHLAADPQWTRCIVPLLAEKRLVHEFGKLRWVRPEGHILDTSIYPPAWVENARTVQPRRFGTQYQQNPQGAIGGLIKPEWIQTYTTPPAAAHRKVISIDIASSTNEGASYSTFLVMASAPGGESYYVVDVCRRRAELHELFALARGLIERHQPHAVLIEETSLGVALISELRRAGVAVSAIKAPRRPKIERLEAHMDVFLRGQLLVPIHASFTKAFMDELCNFPTSRHDDQVDCVTQFLDWVVDPANAGVKHLAVTRNFYGAGHPMRNPRAPQTPRRY